MNKHITRIVLATAVVVAASIASTAGQTPSIAARIEAMSSELLPAAITLRRDLHQHPELGFHETRTAGIVADRLRALKLDEVRTGVGITGVVGILKGGKPGPVIAVRADMDALPIPELIDVPYKSLVLNVKHACGHDGHTSMLLGVAEMLSRVRADLAGTVVFMFQPAEEGDPDGGLTGARRMLDAGVFSNPKPQAVFGLHLVPSMHVGLIGVNSGPTMASADRFTIEIVGKKTHGAMPHTGIDPVPIAAEAVLAFQGIPSHQIDAQQPTVITVGSIAGGNRYNIVADSVKLVGTVRTFSKEGPATVNAKMDAILKGLTTTYGATYTLDYQRNAPVTYNDPGLSASATSALTAAFGKDRVTTPTPQMVSEDFAYYQQQIPGFYFFVGVGNPEKGITAQWHTEYYDMDEAGLEVGMRAMATVVVDALMKGTK